MGLYEEFDGALAVIANTTFHLPPVSSPPILVYHISDVGTRVPRVGTRDSLRPSFATLVDCYPHMPSLTTPSSSHAPTTWGPHFCRRSTPPPAYQRFQSILLMDELRKGGLGMLRFGPRRSVASSSTNISHI